LVKGALSYRRNPRGHFSETHGTKMKKMKINRKSRGRQRIERNHLNLLLDRFFVSLCDVAQFTSSLRCKPSVSWSAYWPLHDDYDYDY